MKDRTRARIIKIRTKETEVMHPGSAEMATNTEAAKATPIETQTFPLDALATSGNKKKIKQIVRVNKEKKGRKQKGLSKELEAQLKAAATQSEEYLINAQPDATSRKRRS